MTQPQNLFIPADAGEKVTLPGIEITIKVTSASTGNAFAVFEEVTSPGVGPSAPCASESVRNFSLSGGDARRSRLVTSSLPPSRERWRSFPGGHAHAFRNIGASDARLQYIIMPGASSDEFFRQISRLLSHGEPDMAALDRLGNNLTPLFVGPPLGH